MQRLPLILIVLGLYFYPNQSEAAICDLFAKRFKNVVASIFHRDVSSNAVTFKSGVKSELLSDFGFFNRRIKVTYPNGTSVVFLRTNRTYQKLITSMLYPPDKLNDLKGKVLDLGCGDGAFVANLRQRGIDAEGVDIWLSQKQVDSKFFKLAESQDIPYQDNSIDFLTATFSTITYELKQGSENFASIGLLKEAHRVLRQGGKILISPVSVEDYPTLRNLLRDNEIRLKISDQPDSTWLNSRFFESMSKEAVLQLPSHPWLELEKY